MNVKKGTEVGLTYSHLKCETPGSMREQHTTRPWVIQASCRTGVSYTSFKDREREMRSIALGLVRMNGDQ